MHGDVGYLVFRNRQTNDNPHLWDNGVKTLVCVCVCVCVRVRVCEIL
jgi:hypothetical protein